MAIFSTNQVRHLFVGNQFIEPAQGGAELTTLGDISIGSDGKNIWFDYLGHGGKVRSDLINIKNIISVSASDASKMKKGLSKKKVVLNGDLEAGQDYILRVAFRQFIGISEEDQYFKYGNVHTTSAMTPSQFYVDMALSLATNFSFGDEGLLKFYLTSSDEDDTPVVKGTKKTELDGTYDGIIIEEAEQDWVLGTKEQVPVYFEVQPTTIVVDGDEVIWGTVTNETPTTFIGNGKKIADLEYFCMGERGDIYRNIGWPKVIPTKYMVNPEEEYHTLDIHYAFVGSNESAQKSEKDITIVSTDVEVINSIGSILNSAGITVPELEEA